MSSLRLFASAILAAGFVAAGSSYASAQVPTCAGRNLLVDMKKNDAADFEALRKEADASTNAKNILWKIERTDAERQASYLLGTLHVTDDRVVKLSPAIEEAFTSVPRIVVEIADADADRRTEGLQTLRGAGKLLLPGQTKLAALLTPAEQTAVLDPIKRTGLPADMAARVQPWAVMAMMSPPCERARLAAGKYRLDTYLARQAELRGDGTVDIETVEMQFDAMASIPQAEQLALLKGQMAMSGRMNDVMETMVQLYLARDLGALWPLQMALARNAGVDAKATDAYFANIIEERTNRMARRMHTHLERGGVFIAVGALHLPGPKGLVQQIMDMGYKVTAVE